MYNFCSVLCAQGFGKLSGLYRKIILQLKHKKVSGQHKRRDYSNCLEPRAFNYAITLPANFIVLYYFLFGMIIRQYQFHCLQENALEWFVGDLMELDEN